MDSPDRRVGAGQADPDVSAACEMGRSRGMRLGCSLGGENASRAATSSMVLKTTTLASHDLEVKILGGIGWTASSRAFALALQVAASTVVARHLSSSDVGLIGFATVFITFLSRFTSFGIDAAIIQRKTLDGRLLATAFSLQGLLGIAAFGATLLIAPFAQRLFDHKGVAGVVIALGTGFLFNVLAFVPVCLLTRELSYGRLAFINASRACAKGLLIIGLVLGGLGYWGIVLAEIAASVIFVVCLGLARPLTSSLHWDTSEARALLRFGAPIVGSNILVSVLFNADKLAVGGILGATLLGYYVLAFNWGSMMPVILSETVNGVLFPAFAKMQDDLPGMKRLYLKSVETVGYLASLGSACLLVCAHDFLIVVQGRGSDKWLPALTCLQILAVYGMLRAMIEPLANVVFALGKTSVLLPLLFNLATPGSAASARWRSLLCPIARRTVSQSERTRHSWEHPSFDGVLRYMGFRKSGVGVSFLLLAAVTYLFLKLPVPQSSVPLHSVARPHDADVSWQSLMVRAVITASTLTLVHGLLTSFRILREAGDAMTAVLRKAAPDIAK